MRKVWKFQPEMKPGPQRLWMPSGAVIVAVGMQGHGNLRIWAEGDVDAPRAKRTVAIVGTGEPIPDGWAYRGTTHDDPFVWHVYEGPS